MAFGNKSGLGSQQAGEQKKENENGNHVFKTSRIKYIVIASILLTSAIALMILAMWAKDAGDEDASTAEADNLYSAARYFCRMKYPDYWEVTPGDNGFYLDDETGLIFQVYPYITQEVKVELEEGATQPPTTPEPLKIPTEGVMVSVFYQANPDFSWPETETLPEGVTPSPTPKITPAPTPTFPPYALTEAADSAVEIMKTKVLPKVAVQGGPEYSFSGGTPYEGKNCSFRAYSYQYTAENGAIMKGEMYVCSRAMAYYMITYEAQETVFDVYKDSYMSMVDNFVFSIFAF